MQRQMRRVLGRGWLALLVAMVAVGAVPAGSITLTWEPVLSSQLAGYRIFRGTSSGNYSQVVDVDAATTIHTISGLGDCTTYFLAIKSRHSNGSESAVFSEEVAGFTRPAVTLVQPAQALSGGTIQIVIEGMSFQDGATLQFSEPAVTASSVVVESCGRITATLTVAAGAPEGAIDITVVNPGNVPGTLLGGLLLTSIPDDPPATVDNLHRTDVSQT